MYARSVGREMEKTERKCAGNVMEEGTGGFGGFIVVKGVEMSRIDFGHAK